jgi:carbamoyltransferase
MIHWGINALNHGSSLAVFKDQELIFNKFNKADSLTSAMIYDGLHFGAPDKIFWYEQPWLKKSRQLYAGQWNRVFDLDAIPSRYLKKARLGYAPVTYTPHHGSHAAAGYYTSPFNHCAIVVLDAIGEWECASIWEGKHNEIKKVWSKSYPNSLGLFYSAFTELLGFKPVQDEFLLQQLSEQGNPDKYYLLIKEYMGSVLVANKNMHQGIWDFPFEITDENRADVAAAVQEVFEEQVDMIMRIAKNLTGADCLVYMGGCAMNSLANKRVVESKFKYTWSLPQPGDPSSSIGAVLYHTQHRVWTKDLGVVKHIQISV